jgi:uncharacterized protein (TIGR02452 family)
MNARHDGSLEQVARETSAIVDAGSYVAPSGARVDIARGVRAAIASTRTFSPEELDVLLDGAPKGAAQGTLLTTSKIDVTRETTQEATHRLVLGESVKDVALLNFASATTAGGGFLRGARAQEEDLARCSALYACLSSQSEFYAFHRTAGTELYSDRMIHSRRVPFFRVRSDSLVEHAFEASVLTAAAPNAGRILLADASAGPEIERVFRRRTGKVLALAEAMGHRTLVLGAWGCGVFRNDPAMAADAFGTWLESARFRASFDRVVFAVYDPRPDAPSHTPFAARLSTRT